jgi:hypothetical protein
MENNIHDGNLFWSMKSEKRFIERLGTGCFCVSGSIPSTRLELLLKYKKALPFRTWDGVDTVENNLPELFVFVDRQIGMERMAVAKHYNLSP